MHYKKLIFITFILITVIPYSAVVFGANETTNEKTNALNEVNQSDITDLEKKIEENERILEELKKQAKEQEQELFKKQKEVNSLQGQLNNFNSDASQLEAKIRIKEQEINFLQLSIRKINLEITAKETEMENIKAQMTALLQDIYKNDEESIIELLFKYEQLSGFFNQVQARKDLQEGIITKLNNLNKLKEELEISKINLQERIKIFEEDKIILRDQKIILDQRRISQKELVKNTKAQEFKYQELLSNIRQQQEETQVEIFNFEQQLRQKLDPNAIPEKGKLFSWPAEGLLTQGYGCTSFAKNSKYYPTCFHNGVDIAATTGTPVYSAADGIVLDTSDAPTAYGKWITIQHPVGLVTLYGHLSLQKVSAGQEVKRGELIGYMGSTGLSTGSHVHFTVFVSTEYFVKPSKYSGMIPYGATLNPFDYLP